MSTEDTEGHGKGGLRGMSRLTQLERRIVFTSSFFRELQCLPWTSQYRFLVHLRVSGVSDSNCGRGLTASCPALLPGEISERARARARARSTNGAKRVKGIPENPDDALERAVTRRRGLIIPSSDFGVSSSKFSPPQARCETGCASRPRGSLCVGLNFEL